MMRWLSHYWVSRSLDDGGKPSALWRHTFGRLSSHKRFASQMNQLDEQLKRQASSQRRAIEREPFPVGRYTRHTTPAVPSSTSQPAGWLRPTLTFGALTAVVGLGVVGAVIWFNTPTVTPQEMLTTATDSFNRVWQPLNRQAETTGRALREQTVHVTSLPGRLPEMDRVVSGLGDAIQSPIQEEVKRLAEDFKRPWAYLAGQLPKLPRDTDKDPAPQLESRAPLGPDAPHV